MVLNNIGEKEFDLLEITEIIAKNESSRCFAVMDRNGNQAKLSWRSDLITPEIIEIDSRYMVIGVDNDFLIIDHMSFKVIIKLRLSWNYQKTLINEESIFILSELEVVSLNKADLTISKYEVLPDLIEKWKIDNYQLEVKCMDGNSYAVVVNPPFTS